MITGEAVLIDVPAAPLPTRVVGAVIDRALYLLLFVGLILALTFMSGGASDATFSTLVLLSMVLCLLVIPVTIETLTRGRSLGKLIMKLRVVRDDGGPIVFRHAFVRGLLSIVEIWTLQGVPALVAAASNLRSKRLGDLAAGTYVVREQTGMKLVAPPEPPPYLREWARSADIAPLPDGVALAMRQFLIRRWTLSPAARAALTDNLLAQVQPLVSPPPPPRTNPEDFLSAVLAERSARDGARLQRDNGIRARLLPPDQLNANIRA